MLRPSLPLYLRDIFGANYRMVTLIPVVFGVGKWVANLPTGYVLNRVGRIPLMVAGLLLIAACDVASIAANDYPSFLSARAGAGMGWAMFATVATTAMLQRGTSRGRAISTLLLAETLGLLVGSAAGGSLYAYSRPTTPFVIEGSCMVLAATAVGWFGLPPTASATPVTAASLRGTASVLLHVPGYVLMCCTNAAVAAIQTGVLVFLFPLYLVERGAVSAQTVGYLVALGVLGRLLGLWLAVRISDRRERVSTLQWGLTVFAVVLATFVVVKGSALFGLWSMLVGGAAGFIAGFPTTIIGDRVDTSLHAVAIAWLRTATDAGMLLGPLLMGPVADAVDIAAPFVLAGIISCVLAWACSSAAPGRRSSTRRPATSSSMTRASKSTCSIGEVSDRVP